MTFLLPFVAALLGCAAHEVGLVDAAQRRTRLSTADGRSIRLVLLDDDANDLASLDRHLVEVDGQRTPAGLRVGRFRVLEGPHALSVWYGPVQRYGVQVGILDQASGSLVFVDEEAAADLAPYLGDRVAAEGYVEGPQRIRVQHWVAIE